MLALAIAIAAYLALLASQQQEALKIKLSQRYGKKN
jgi:hypothetical protein